MNYKKLLLPISSLSILSALVLFSARAETPNIPQNPALGSSWVRDFVAQSPEYKDMPITDRTEKSITFQRSDGQLVTQSVDFTIHYKDARGEWQPLDTTLQYFPETNEWSAPGFSTRIKPDGKVSIKEEDGGIFNQRTVNYGNLNSETGEFSTLGQFEEGSANGDTLVRKSGEVEHKIKLTDLGVKEEMILPSAPTGIPADGYLVMKTELGADQLFPDGWLDEASMAEHHLPAPFSFDANQKPIPTKRYAQYIDGYQYVYTGVLGSTLSEINYPLTIDPDYLCSTNDGHVRGASATYATARSTSNLFNSTSTVFYVGQQFVASSYYVWRGFLKFDTSAIPDSDTVTQVNLKMVCVEDGSTVDFDVQIVKQNWSAQDPLSTANREAAYDNCLSGTADDNIWRNTNGIVSNTQYASGNLNTAWVNKTGNTYYSLRSSRDFNNNTPTGDEFINIASQDHATVAYRPILTVVHVHPLFKLFYNVKLFQNVKFFYTP